MKKIFLLNFLFFSFVSFANEEEEFCKDIIGKCYCEKISPEEEICKSFYENGNPDLVMPIKNGKIHGELKKYHENRTLWFINNYYEDTLHGIMVSFDKQGNFNFFAHMLKGKEQGITVNYYKDKNEFAISEYENGKLLKLRKFIQTKEIDKELMEKLRIEKNEKKNKF